MNFLAHLLIADQTQSSLVGNLLPDLCKPKDWTTLSEPLVLGARQHQRVDRLTDTHPAFLTCKSAISDYRRRWAGVILDVALDHFLASHWNSFCDEPLADFSQRCYLSFQAENELPLPVSWVLSKMSQHHWLESYADIEGIAMAFRGLSRRVRFDNPLIGAETELLDQHVLWQSQLLTVFSEVRDAIQKQPLG